MRRVARMDVSRRSYECVLSHIWMSHVIHMKKSITWLRSLLQKVNNMTQVSFDSGLQKRPESCYSYEKVNGKDSIQLQMTHSCVCHDSFMCVTGLIDTCDMTHAHVWHDHSCVWHDAFVRVTWRIHMHAQCHTQHTQMGGMGWLRLVGSIKLQVSSAEYSLFYRALLQ